MKTTIRKETFETNSSSVHALVVLSPEQFESVKDRTNTLICRESRYSDYDYDGVSQEELTELKKNVEIQTPTLSSNVEADQIRNDTHLCAIIPTEDAEKYDIGFGVVSGFRIDKLEDRSTDALYLVQWMD